MSLGNLLRPRAVDSAPAPDVPGPHVDIVTVSPTDLRDGR